MNPAIIVASLAAFARLAFAATYKVDSTMIAEAVEAKAREDATLSNSAKCSRALEGIIYTPETCAYQYLQRIADQIKLQIPQVFSEIASGNLNVISSIAAAYGITVYLATPYGNPVQGTSDAVALTSMFKDAAMARSYLNFDGFDSDNGAQVWNYQFTLISIDANFIFVRLSLPWTNAPIGCK